ncbi:ABC-type nitrate/sulfonate/bicarbonate transport system permease component [Arthrobacter sp. SLBN-100]|uniref:ABC transporter permease n=1 Tax=Arthrobacter sp. SLBN-100 TaxID=2768450 RepID=UPI0011514A57|nr:ABC transporter permease [Arthrobacter sp. SLBN-100]TQJ62126.1 ABC-type nitrate/sulfonate/bicarbonate transport system permease component [Arthrobacter sp. SLBN-100]
MTLISTKIGRKGGSNNRKRGSFKSSETLIGIAAVLLFILAWQLVTTAVRFPYFPPPSRIIANAVSRWFDGPWYMLWVGPNAATQLLPSIERLLAGWAIAVIVGIAVGFAIGLLPRFARYVEPPMTFVRNLPPTALIPVFLLILGVGDSMKIIFISSTVVWPILLNTIDGVQSVDQTQLSTARSYGIRRSRVLSHIILPSALPKIFAALRISLSLALILMVISEMVAATNGIGFEILKGQRTFRIVDMWSGIIVLSVLGFLLNQIVQLIEHRALRWHRGARNNG